MLSCVVTRHCAFGFFTKIEKVPFVGLVEIVDITDETRPLTPKDFPALGTEVQTVVLGYRESGRQIALGMKPSQLSQFSGE